MQKRDDIGVIQYGLGPIGAAVARHAVERPGISLVGCVDVDPDKVGKDVGDVIGLDRELELTVAERLADVLESSEAQVVLHATSSRFRVFTSQIVEILEAGMDVVSTAEELSFPWLRHADYAKRIDDLAQRGGCTVLGTGVNPGFIMDALPLNLTGICQEVHHIAVTRVIDASQRRGPFQAKIGVGMRVGDFKAAIDAGQMGHVGLPESIDMVCDRLGKHVTHVESSVDPLVADRRLETEDVCAERGQVRGLRQVARAFTEAGEFLRLTFVAGLGVEDEGDAIVIEGTPNLSLTVKGTNGDIATAAIVVNAVPRVLEAAPGLTTMRDLPAVTHW